MKKATKFFAVLLASLMLVSVANVTTPVMAAADTYTVQLTGTDTKKTTNHEYTVYQLYTGNLTVTGSGDSAVKTLSNVVYGTAWTASGDTTSAKAAGKAVPESELNGLDKNKNASINAETAETFADNNIANMVTSYGTLSSSNGWKLEGVPTGYYLIVDDTSKTIANGDTYSKYIVQVVSDVNIAPKSETVTSDKKVLDDTASESTVNEVGVGSVVSYKLTGTIAQDADKYDYYSYIMCDTLSAGLTFQDDIVVYDGTTQLTEGTNYAVYTGEDGYTFEVALLDAKSRNGHTITVNYSAVLNSGAVVTTPENNDFKVVYSNDPEHSYKGNYEPEGDTPNQKPGKPISTTNNPTGITTEKKTYTYSTQIVLTKQDESGNKLEGATFRLTSDDANQAVYSTGKYYQLDDTNGTYYLLKDGSYTTEAPTGTTYEEIGTGDSKTTQGYLKKTEDGNDVYYVPANTSEYVDQTIYRREDANTSAYVYDYGVLHKYSLVDATSTGSVAAPVDITLTTDSDGKLTFEDLGAGTYTLTEVDAPDGFNYVNPVSFTIKFTGNTTNSTGAFSVDETKTNSASATYDSTNKQFLVTITDKAGSVLPSTGGIGTTIFYVVGAILVLGAGIVLVARKRVER